METTTYKLNAYHNIIEIVFVGIFYNLFNLLWIKYCLNQA